MKESERIIEARLRDRVEMSKQQWIYAMKGNHRCHACLKKLMEKYRGSKRTTLCICRPRESLRQGSAGRAVVLHEKIRNTGKVFATCTGYV